MTNILSPIPEGAKRGWEITVTRHGRTQELHNVSDLTMLTLPTLCALLTVLQVPN